MISIEGDSAINNQRSELQGCRIKTLCVSISNDIGGVDIPLY